MRALTLIVRNLDARAITEVGTRCPALESFLSRCDVTVSRHNSIVGWACATHGIERQRDWPAGAILARASDEPTAELANDGHADGYWLCAQPVHLAVDRDSLILQPPSELGLSAQESRQLFAALTKHLAQEQLKVKYAGSGIWCIGTGRSQDLLTTEPERAQGRAVDGLLPGGADARWWQRLITEAQMILHEHPVNVAREARGEVPVNSVWIWGGGDLAAVESRFDAMSVTDPFLRALARLSGAQLIDAPVDPLRHSSADNMLVEFALQADGAGEGLSALETRWLLPAWQGLANGRLDELTLVLPLTDTVALCRCSRRERRRFWRRQQSIAGFLARFPETNTRP